MAKTLSICIPSYNCGAFIGDTIESVLRQSQPADEVIISDDHSTDDSMEIIERYSDRAGLRIIRPDKRLTLGQHYRFLLEHAQCDYITFLSADDVLFPGFVEAIRHVLDDGNDIKLVNGACIETDDALNVIQARGTGRQKAIYPYPKSFEYMSSGNLYTVSFSAMERKRLLEAPILTADADLATDWYWALWLTAAGSLAFVKKPLGFYRIHQSNAGHNNSTWIAALPKMLEFLIPHLPEEERELASRRLAEMKRSVSPSSGRAGTLDTVRRFIKTLQAQPYKSLSSSFGNGRHSRKI